MSLNIPSYHSPELHSTIQRYATLLERLDDSSEDQSPGKGTVDADHVELGQPGQTTWLEHASLRYGQTSPVALSVVLKDGQDREVGYTYLDEYGKATAAVDYETRADALAGEGEEFARAQGGILKERIDGLAHMVEKAYHEDPQVRARDAARNPLVLRFDEPVEIAGLGPVQPGLRWTEGGQIDRFEIVVGGVGYALRQDGEVSTYQLDEPNGRSKEVVSDRTGRTRYRESLAYE